MHCHFRVFLSLLLTMTACTDSLSTLPASSRRKKWLVVDYDKTCSKDDTTSLLPKLAAILSDDNVEERHKRFKEFEDEYFRLYAAAKEEISPETQKLEEALDALDDVSNIVTQQVSDSGVLKGINVSSNEMVEALNCVSEDLRDCVTLQPNCLDVLSKAMKNDWQLGVLSINWSPSLIHATLVRYFSLPISRKIPIWSNTVNENGVVSLFVPGALAKRSRISKLQEPTSLVVYVGDSSTDLLALLQADIGILIGSCDSAVEIAKQWGIQVLPLKQRRASDGGLECDVTIWRADSWSEIGKVLDGIEV